MKATSFEKRVKRRIIGPKHTFYAVCAPGLESVCKTEMLAAGFHDKELRISRGGVEFDAKLSNVVGLNLKLASPSRILMRISQFKADSFSKLEKKIMDIDWELYLPQKCPIEIKAMAKKSRLYHSDAIAQRGKNAISSYLEKNAVFEAPDKVQPTQTIYFRTEQDRFTVSLDTSGELLYKRGIKQKITSAPIRENIAFAMLFWAEFSKDSILVDPMCGSGTFSLEAALIKSALPPGFFRTFAFESWPGFSSRGFSYLKKQAKKQMTELTQKQIFASDMDKNAIDALTQNISAHSFRQAIDIHQEDFFSFNPLNFDFAQMSLPQAEQSSKGVIMLNPPYGKRMGSGESTPDFFCEIAEKLKSDFSGWKLGIILPDKTCVSALGLPLDFKPVFHGGLDVFAGIGTIL